MHFWQTFCSKNNVPSFVRWLWKIFFFNKTGTFYECLNENETPVILHRFVQLSYFIPHLRFFFVSSATSLIDWYFSCKILYRKVSLQYRVHLMLQWFGIAQKNKTRLILSWMKQIASLLLNTVLKYRIYVDFNHAIRAQNYFNHIVSNVKLYVINQTLM